MMPVTEILQGATGLATLAVVFLAGRLWGRGDLVRRSERVLGSVVAVETVAVFTLSLAWNFDLFHRAFYVFYAAAMGALVVTGGALILFAVRDRKGRALYLPLMGAVLLGLTTAVWSLATRTTVGPPVGFLTLSLLAAPVLAIAPRLGVKGYRIHRDQDCVGWALLFLAGFVGLVETIAVAPLMPGVAIRGRPSFVFVFVAAMGVFALLEPRRQVRLDPPPEQPLSPIPWHLFNPAPSPREADLIPGLRRRLTNKELAAEGGLSESTVKKHVASLFRKAGVEGRQELIEKMDRGS